MIKKPLDHYPKYCIWPKEKARYDRRRKYFEKSKNKEKPKKIPPLEIIPEFIKLVLDSKQLSKNNHENIV